MAASKRAPRGCACATRCLCIKRRVPDHGRRQGRRIAEMFESKLHKGGIGFSFGDVITARDRVDQVIHIHQAAIVIQLIGLTIGGERDASSLRLDGREGFAQAGNMAEPPAGNARDSARLARSGSSCGPASPGLAQASPPSRFRPSRRVVAVALTARIHRSCAEFRPSTSGSLQRSRSGCPRHRKYTRHSSVSAGL